MQLIFNIVRRNLYNKVQAYIVFITRNAHAPAKAAEFTRPHNRSWNLRSCIFLKLNSVIFHAVYRVSFQAVLAKVILGLVYLAENSFVHTSFPDSKMRFTH